MATAILRLARPMRRCRGRCHAYVRKTHEGCDRARESAAASASGASTRTGQNVFGCCAVLMRWTQQRISTFTSDIVSSQRRH